MFGAMQLDGLKWDQNGLIPAIVQDRLSGEIRMLAHANHAALRATLESGYATFWSRSRQQLWRKGETSGHTLRVSEIWIDCDGDALIYLAESAGPSCHTERETCFFARVGSAGFAEDPEHHAQSVLPRLWSELQLRRTAANSKSYTKTLLDAGVEKIGAKVHEEAGELVQALQSEAEERVVSEAADLVYHVFVGLLARGVSPNDVARELGKRFGTSGLVEKASRS